MTDYIERKALDKALAVAGALDSVKRRKAWVEAVCIVHDMPAADVAPVVHAENVTNAHPSDEFECSNCGLILRNYSRYDPEEDAYYEFTDWNHCPRCGARMDGE